MKRPGDTQPDPPGGRAAERLRQFEDARLPPEEREQRSRERAKEQPRSPAPKKRKGRKK